MVVISYDSNADRHAWWRSKLSLVAGTFAPVQPSKPLEWGRSLINTDMLTTVSLSYSFRVTVLLPGC